MLTVSTPSRTWPNWIARPRFCYTSRARREYPMRRLTFLAAPGALFACARTDPGPFRGQPGADGGPAGDGGDGGPSATLLSIDITPADATTAVGVAVQFSAAGHYSDNTVRIVTDKAT